jgi:hypothetical protein
MVNQAIFRGYVNNAHNSTFTLRSLLSILEAIKPLCAPNTHWGRVDVSSLSLFVLVVMILASKRYSVSTFIAFSQRTPALNNIVIGMLRELFPLHRVDRSYTLDLCQDPFDLLRHLRDEISISEKPLSGVLSEQQNYTHFKRTTLGTLDELLALENDSEMFVSRCIDLLVNTNTYLEAGIRDWHETRVYLSGESPEIKPLGYKRIFRVGGDLFAFSGSEYPSTRCLYLYKLLVSGTIVSYSNESQCLSAPSPDDTLVYVYDSNPIAMWINVFSSLKIESAGSTQRDTVPPTQESGTGTSDRSGRNGQSGSRRYSTAANPSSKSYRYCVISDGVAYYSDDVSIFDRSQKDLK